MPGNAKCAVWDTCVIIDAIQKTAGRYERIEPYLIDAEQNKFTIVVCEGTVGEVSALGGSSLSEPDQVQLIEQWFENPYIVRRNVSPGLSKLAAQCGRQYKIKRLGDRLVVATALFSKIGLVHTFDGENKNDGLISLNGRIPGLTIEAPNYQGALFGGKQ